MLLKSLSYTQIVDFLETNMVEAKDLFIKKDYTAKQLANHFNILHNNNFQKACFRVLGDKGKGLGGARLGSGNIKEIKKRKTLNAITISVSDEVLKILKSHRGTYTMTIERAVKYYDKVANRKIED